MRILILLLLINFSHNSLAEIVSDDLPSRLGMGGRFVQEAGADLKRQDRTAWSLTWQQSLWQRFRLDSGLFLAPDPQTLPRSVRVKDDWYGGFIGLDWSHPWYFRWTLASGLIGQYERTTIQLNLAEQKQSRSEHRYQLYPYLRAGMDYAINQSFEVSLDLGWQQRSTAKTFDWFWGLSVAYNVH
ncbi:MAG: hypothetical protein ACOH5I_18785 [Oligoflexus sp.]